MHYNESQSAPVLFWTLLTLNGQKQFYKAFLTGFHIHSSEHMHGIRARLAKRSQKFLLSAHRTPTVLPAVTSAIKALTHTSLNIRLVLDPVTIIHRGQRNHFPGRLRNPVKRPIKNSAYITFTTKICLQ